jgi:hypothetical protein
VDRALQRQAAALVLLQQPYEGEGAPFPFSLPFEGASFPSALGSAFSRLANRSHVVSFTFLRPSIVLSNTRLKTVDLDSALSATFPSSFLSAAGGMHDLPDFDLVPALFAVLEAATSRGVVDQDVQRPAPPLPRPEVRPPPPAPSESFGRRSKRLGPGIKRRDA